MKITKGTKIGVTSMDDTKIWSNGLYQNAYHLANILSAAGYHCDMITESKDIAKNKFLEREIVLLDDNNLGEYDIILEVVHTLRDSTVPKFKAKGGVVAGIQYGNEFMIDVMADSIYRPEKPPRVNKQDRDAVLMSPHFDFSQQAISIMYDLDVKVCPYIWSPKFLFMNEKEEELRFNPEKEMKSVAVMESNLYFVKTCHIPMLAIEHAYRQDPDLFEYAYIVGSKVLEPSKGFIRFANLLNVKKDKKMFFEPRYRFPFLIKRGYSDVIVSHQHYNALNYLQLEAMYLGIPFIHNSHYFKDNGYYYHDFNAKDAAAQIKNAFENHKNVFEEKMEKDRAKVYEYHPENPKNIEGYAELVEWLLEKRAKENKKSKLFIQGKQKGSVKAKKPRRKLL